MNILNRFGFIGGEEPKPTKRQLNEANSFAKNFAMRRHLISGENTHVGNQIPKFVDQSGGEVNENYSNIPSSMIMNVPPPYVKQLEWDKDANLPFFIDEKTGDAQYVKKDWFFSNRFNPNRGQNGGL